MEKMEIELSYIGKERIVGRKRGKGDKKRELNCVLYMCKIPHDECDHYALQTHTTGIKSCTGYLLLFIFWK